MNPSKKDRADPLPTAQWSAGACGIPLLLGLFSCEPELVVGSLPSEACDPTAVPDGQAGASGIAPVPVATPFRTSFEDGVCAYTKTTGYCYSDAASEYHLVSAPARSGVTALTFQIAANGTATENMQARCVQQGILPQAATYSAWFYLPRTIDQAENLNLFHFDGREPGEPHGLWDVSILRERSGSLRLFVRDFLRDTTHPLPLRELPIGQWFEIEVLLVRASDQRGRFAVYLNGELGLDLTNIVTDDTQLGQWYLGNLAALLSPLPYALYVDDVAIDPLTQ